MTWLMLLYEFIFSRPSLNHALIAFSESEHQRVCHSCQSSTRGRWALLKATSHCDSAFLNHFPIRSLTAATTYQLQTFQLLLPRDDIQPWDPVHLQSMRVSGYCIFSIDVPNDMAITDAGHESKVLNHPASWCVQQVVLSDSSGYTTRRHRIEMHAGSDRLCCPGPRCVLSPLYLVQVYIWASHGPHRLFLPCVNRACERNDPIKSTKPERKERRKKISERKYLRSISKHNSCTLLLGPSQIRKA